MRKKNKTNQHLLPLIFHRHNFTPSFSASFLIRWCREWEMRVVVSLEQFLSDTRSSSFPCSGVGALHDLQCCMGISTEDSLLWHLCHLLFTAGCLQGTLKFYLHAFPEVPPSVECVELSCTLGWVCWGERDVWGGSLSTVCTARVRNPCPAEVTTKSVPLWLLLVSCYPNSQRGSPRSEGQEGRVFFCRGWKKWQQERSSWTEVFQGKAGRRHVCLEEGRDWGTLDFLKLWDVGSAVGDRLGQGWGNGPGEVSALLWEGALPGPEQPQASCVTAPEAVRLCSHLGSAAVPPAATESTKYLFTAFLLTVFYLRYAELCCFFFLINDSSRQLQLSMV